MSLHYGNDKQYLKMSGKAATYLFCFSNYDKLLEAPFCKLQETPFCIATAAVTARYVKGSVGHAPNGGLL
jgi:hypothetical protein